MPREKTSKKRKVKATKSHWDCGGRKRGSVVSGVCFYMVCVGKGVGGDGLTTVVFKANMAEIMIMQKQQAAALDINILRRPRRSMKK